MLTYSMNVILNGNDWNQSFPHMTACSCESMAARSALSAYLRHLIGILADEGVIPVSSNHRIIESSNHCILASSHLGIPLTEEGLPGSGGLFCRFIQSQGRSEWWFVVVLVLYCTLQYLLWGLYAECLERPKSTFPATTDKSHWPPLSWSSPISSLPAGYTLYSVSLPALLQQTDNLTSDK